MDCGASFLVVYFIVEYFLMSVDDKYNELIMAVGNKYPNETRHETALRYIQEREDKANSYAASIMESNKKE